MKSRALTDLLSTALNKTLETKDGKHTSRKRIIAENVAQAISTGTAIMPDGKQLDLSPKDWMEFTKWLYTHIDGPAITKQENTNINIDYTTLTDKQLERLARGDDPLDVITAG
jgi:hypothetical protein